MLPVVSAKTFLHQRWINFCFHMQSFVVECKTKQGVVFWEFCDTCFCMLCEHVFAHGSGDKKFVPSLPVPTARWTCVAEAHSLRFCQLSRLCVEPWTLDLARPGLWMGEAVLCLQLATVQERLAEQDQQNFWCSFHIQRLEAVWSDLQALQSAVARQIHTVRRTLESSCCLAALAFWKSASRSPTCILLTRPTLLRSGA